MVRDGIAEFGSMFHVERRRGRRSARRNATACEVVQCNDPRGTRTSDGDRTAADHGGRSRGPASAQRSAPPGGSLTTSRPPIGAGAAPPPERRSGGEPKPRATTASTGSVEQTGECRAPRTSTTVTRSAESEAGDEAAEVIGPRRPAVDEHDVAGPAAARRSRGPGRRRRCRDRRPCRTPRPGRRRRRSRAR